MKIGIEAQRIFRKKKHGMDTVAIELIRQLQKIDQPHEYVVFVQPDEDHDVIRETANMKIVALNGGPYPIWEQISLPIAAKKHGCDILHCTGNTGPVNSKIPLILTLHDIIYLERSVLSIMRSSNSAYQKFGNLYRKWVVPELVKKCRKIITVSAFERQRISDHFRMENDSRLITVYNGVGEDFKRVSDHGELRRIREKYGLPDRYFFFFGNMDPKKNTPGTLQAFSRYLQQTKDDVKLVMTDFNRSELKKMLQCTGDTRLEDRIILTGYVDHKDLPTIYSQCALFLYTSLRESFGLPILEAMACGAPVITSDSSSMPEVAGSAALLTDPFSPQKMADAMVLVQENPAVRRQMITEGYRRASAFSWATMAEKMLEIYGQAASELKQPDNTPIHR